MAKQPELTSEGMHRLKVLLLLGALNEEAFQWVAVALTSKVWPDGLGGFTDRATIMGVQSSANEYLKGTAV